MMKTIGLKSVRTPLQLNSIVFLSSSILAICCSFHICPSQFGPGNLHALKHWVVVRNINLSISYVVCHNHRIATTLTHQNVMFDTWHKHYQQYISITIKRFFFIQIMRKHKTFSHLPLVEFSHLDSLGFTCPDFEISISQTSAPSLILWR